MCTVVGFWALTMLEFFNYKTLFSYFYLLYNYTTSEAFLIFWQFYITQPNMFFYFFIFLFFLNCTRIILFFKFLLFFYFITNIYFIQMINFEICLDNFVFNKYNILLKNTLNSYHPFFLYSSSCGVFL